MKKVIFLVIFLQQIANAKLCEDCTSNPVCAWICETVEKWQRSTKPQKTEVTPVEERTKNSLPNQ